MIVRLKGSILLQPVTKISANCLTAWYCTNMCYDKDAPSRNVTAMSELLITISKTSLAINLKKNIHIAFIFQNLYCRVVIKVSHTHQYGHLQNRADLLDC